ncbi:MAG TPA: TolC family protein [Gemmatimonadales bacterium]|jgi:outer membrane protein TolC
MIIAIFLSLGAASPDTLVLSLNAAMAHALAANPALLAERADARAAATLTGSASRAFLPSIRADVMGVRTTDPVGVFGMKLRQGVFAGGDLALDALNSPAAFGGYTSSATVELPLLAPEGWFGYAAAGRGAAARSAAAERMAGATVFMVTHAYLEAQLTARRLTALDTSLAATRAHERQADALRREGLVTGLDARLASLQAADVEVRRLAAVAEAQNSLSRLRALLALPETTVLVLTDSLAGDRPTTCTDAACALDARGDLRALEAGREAAGAARKSAWAAQLPQLGAFGTVAYHGHDAPWSTGSGDWTLGIALRWNVFPALGGIAAVRKATAERDAATARHDAALRRAEVEVLEATRLLDAARQGAAVAARAEGEAREALAQAQLRYRTGAAPITELLDVQSAAMNATLSHLTARRDLLLAQAALDFAYGVHDR